MRRPPWWTAPILAVMPMPTSPARWWAARGIRARSTLVALLAVGLALVVGGMGLIVLLRTGLSNAAADTALLRAQDFATQFVADEDAARTAVRTISDDGTVIQVLDAHGRVSVASAALAGAGPIAAPVDGGPLTTVASAPLPGSGSYVVASVAATTAKGPVTVVAADSLAGVDAAVRAAATSLLIAGPILLLTVGLSTWIAVGRSLAGVDRIREQVESIETGNLHRRVPEPVARDGIRRLAETMNEMLERLERAAAEQRRFVGDASHELNSPLASIRATIDAAPHARLTAVDTGIVSEEVDRMSRLVTDLLLLARSDDSHLRRSLADVDLDDLVGAEAVRVRAQTPLVVVTDIETVRVTGDRDQLHRAVRNIVDNAAHHARARIDLRLGRGPDGGAVVSVCDDGPGIVEADRDRVFDRFVRLDASRTRAHGGAGLGLSIVAGIVDAHGGQVTICDSDLGGAQVTITLPPTSTASSR